MAVLSHVSTWAVGALVLVLLLRRCLTPGKQIRRHGKRLRKAPDTLPLVGNGILFMQERQKLFAWFTKCERLADYETLQVSVPTLPPGIVVHDPLNLDFIFRNESLFSKGSFVKSRAWDLFGHGIINADGEAWRLQRKAGAAFLSTANLRVLTDVALPRFLGEELDRLKRVADAGGTVDLQEVFHEITTRLMGKMAYNMDMHTDDAFTTAFDHASGATALRFQNPLWPLTELITGRRFRRSVATVKSFGQKIVASAVADRHSSQRSTPDPKAVSDNTADTNAEKLDQISGTLIHSFLDTIPDHQVVADAALNYLSAGRDTTAQALTWTFHLLFRSPQALSQIRSEALAVLNSAPDAKNNRGNSNSNPLARLTPQSLPYTLATLYESLRLYPPIPLEIKQLVSSRPVTLPDGTVLPPDSVVVWCPWALGRSRRTWGPDADSFRPERWLVFSDSDSTGKKKGPPTMVQRPASEFPVFNGGPRSCLGKKMAEVIGCQVIAAVAVGFDLEPVDDGKGRGERRSKISLTLPMEGGLPVTVRRRT
ncbi:monooxygenase-like protein [Coniochaeta ligniaria NRRL 30616]|uniref:Monooxygenase-like protein n=1 Tax=Coniochaeta ligniaria NRRL 30616 TaxID=1408157 RepID=A0A1J7IB26_9PEZI|nr:monooxygenase-like protein [Coniochaeta ligniaria NRRL 30616]